MTDAIKRVHTPVSTSIASNVTAIVGASSAKENKAVQRADAFARVRGPAGKQPTKQYIVFESAAASSLLGARMAPRPFNPKLQQGKGWRVLELTLAEVNALRSAKVPVFSNVPVSVGPKPTPIADETNQNAPRTSLFRDVHGITALQNEAGWAGEGVMLVIVDTGIGQNKDVQVPKKFDDVQTEQPEDPPSDGHGHGTHCSGSSTGIGKLEEGGIRGMAPNAALHGVKVLDDSGSGTMADVMKGVETAIDWAKAWDGPAVISMSLGGQAEGEADMQPLNKLINDAIAQHGIYFSIAAGNEGPSEGTIGDPGRAKLACTMGAIDHKRTLDEKDDVLASFSSRDPASGAKPTRSADGVNQLSTLPGDKRAEFSGTSMATPVNAGGVACLLGKAWALFKAGKLKVDPRDLVKNGELDKLINSTCKDNANEPANHEGAGDVRFEAAAKKMLEVYGK